MSRGEPRIGTLLGGPTSASGEVVDVLDAVAGGLDAVAEAAQFDCVAERAGLQARASAQLFTQFL